MKNTDNSEMDSILNDFPENLVKLIHGLLDDKNYTIKHNAGKALVKKGKTIIPQMHKLLSSKNSLLRKEAARIVELIADRRSISLLIGLLEDKESDIRWIAAEGLVKIGRQSILPLLKSVRDNKNSYYLNTGAHHVLNSLLQEKEKKELVPLMQSLGNYHQMGGIASAEAVNALKTVFKRHA
jgi:HEAT repeat protein